VDATSTPFDNANNRGPTLTVDTVVPYLLQRGLVTSTLIVDGDLEITDVGRRNENIKVVCRNGPSYFLKQPGEGEPSTQATMCREAAFYSLCQISPEAASLLRIIPGFHCWDEDRFLLILELINGHPLWEHYATTIAPDFPCDSAVPLGEALGTLHRVYRARSSQSELSSVMRLPSSLPWILFGHRPSPDIFTRLSPGGLQVLKLLQRDRPMTAELDSLRNEWIADTVIHGDIKGDNVLVIAPADEDVQVSLVDWELMQVGDAAWDVGNVFHDFLGYWLLSVPLSGDLAPEQMLEKAQIPLANLHPATRSFWNAYRDSVPLNDAAGNFLIRSVRFAAARMAQGAYELSASTQFPSNLAIMMLQLAANILADPSNAVLHLLGISAPWRQSGHVPSNS
jgi:hypothetical protein